MSSVMKQAPMGWNSWDCWGTGVTEETVRANADCLAKTFRPYGWEYVIVELQWHEPNGHDHFCTPFAEVCVDGYSRVIPAPNRFPSSENGKGFTELADYVHSLGLKFGIHMMRGIPRQAVHQNLPILGTDKRARDVAKTNSICDWCTDMYGVDPHKEGAREYYDSVFRLYASWGVDYIKLDDIAKEMPQCEEELILMSECLRNCGREIVFSLSPGPALPEKAELYKQTANMWRISGDFWDNWQQLYDMFGYAQTWCVHAGAGHWPDADILAVGPIRQLTSRENRTRLTGDEQRTMMTLWSILRSPLLIGGDLRGMDDFTRDLLTCEGILDLHRDARHSHPVWRKKIGGSEYVLWTAVSASGGSYLAVFNIGEEDSEITVDPADAELYGSCTLTELWSGERLCSDGRIAVKLPHHGVKAFLLKES